MPMSIPDIENTELVSATMSMGINTALNPHAYKLALPFNFLQRNKKFLDNFIFKTQAPLYSSIYFDGFSPKKSGFYNIYVYLISPIMGLAANLAGGAFEYFVILKNGQFNNLFDDVNNLYPSLGINGNYIINPTVSILSTGYITENDIISVAFYQNVFTDLLYSGSPSNIKIIIEELT